MTQEYYDRYKAQSQELYTFLSRSFQDVFKFCEQPYQFGTHMSGSSVNLLFAYCHTDVGWYRTALPYRGCSVLLRNCTDTGAGCY
jgi:hypothetical protein